MRLPPGCGKRSGKIVRLLKCQYGMEQAGRVWHLLLVKWSVIMMRMEQCKAEPCIFRKMGMVSLMVGVHVDDSIVSGESDVCYESFSDLKQRTPMEHQGELKMYTGCPFERDWENGILDIYQKAFAENMMTQYGITTGSSIPASNGEDLRPRAEGESGGNEEFADYHAFCVGGPILMSVMTRQDIVNALRPCARHSHTPTVRHWKALLQKVVYYVNATKGIGLSFLRGSGLRLSVFAGADYAVAPNGPRFVYVVAVVLGDTAIIWKISTQKCVTTTTCETECATLFDAAKYATFEREVFIFLQSQLAGMCLDVFVDNEDAMAIVNNPTSRSKHIDVMKFHFIQGLVRINTLTF